MQSYLGRLKKILVNKTVYSQSTLQNLYFLAFFLFWISRYFNDLWLFQQLHAPVFYTGNDLSYTFLASFPFFLELIQSIEFSLLFDFSLVLTALFCLIFKKSRSFNIFFSILLLGYIIIHYSALGAHKHNLTGLWFCSLLFWFKTKIDFANAFKILRLYVIYAYASAGFWKFYRNAFDADYFFSTILKSHNAQYLFGNPDSLKTHIIEFLLNHAAIGDLMFQCMTIGEAIFIVALFTTKWDKFLALFAISFHTVSYFLVNVFFFEFTLILLPLFFLPKYTVDQVLPISWFKSSKLLIVVSFVFLIGHICYFDKVLKLIKFNDFDKVLFYGAYPIQNYMMYSYPYHSETFDDFQIYANGELLVQQSWLPIKTEQFEENILLYNVLKRSNFIDSNKQNAKDKFPNVFEKLEVEVNPELYKDWIILKTAKLANCKPEELEIFYCEYQFENSKPVLVKKEPAFN